VGASFIDRTVPASLTPAELQKQFLDWQADAAHEDGHSYSGNWNMASGLVVHANGTVYPSVDSALEWLQERCQKWEEARAVRAVEAQPVSPTYDGEPGRMWLDQFSVLAQRKYVPRGMEYTVVLCDQLNAPEKTVVGLRLPEWEAAKASEATALQGLRSLSEQLKDLATPLPPDLSDIDRLRQEADASRTRREELEASLTPIVTALRARLASAGTSRDVWVVGAWAAS
jgi:hypothetical protein